MPAVFYTYPQKQQSFPLGKIIAVCQYVDMVCPYCGSVTVVANSRHQKRSNQVWRRRECVNCHAKLTTNERYDYRQAIAVKDEASNLTPFKEEKMLLSIYKSCGHRINALDDALALTHTVVEKILLTQAQHGLVSTKQLVEVIFATLNKFDPVSAIHYKAYHK